jgi:hypothetical protein
MPRKPVGWRKEPARHALAAKGVKTGTRHRMGVPSAHESPTNPEDHVSVGGNNWSVESFLDGTHADLRMDDHIGWKWDGDETSWDIFILRMAKSGIKNEFQKNMDLTGLEYDAVRKLIANENYDLESAVYSLTGDNVFWHFGETDDIDHEMIIEYAQDEIHLNRDQRDAFVEYFWRNEKMGAIADFDQFKGTDAYKNLVKEVRSSFKNAHSWEEILDELSSDSWADTALEVKEEWIASKVYPELHRIGEQWLKKQAEE